MSDIALFDKDLNDKILTGKALEAFDQYYADDVVMQENSDAPFEGKEFNRKREIEYFGTIAEFHGAKVEAVAVTGDTSFSQWWLDVTFNNGFRYTNTQVAVRQWKDGKIVHERFFYNKG
jgi:ketosteroid isomerase-like protein